MLLPGAAKPLDLADADLATAIGNARFRDEQSAT